MLITKTLNNGVEIPAAGMGFWQINNKDNIKEIISQSYSTGISLMDTASAYGNEALIGSAIQELEIPRNDLFITTKLWNSSQGYDSTLKAFNHSLKKLKTDYLDLYLIHWPVKDKFVDSWKAMEKLYEEGYVKSIGVCNFQKHHLQTLLNEVSNKPAINQVEYHPYLVQTDLHNYCIENDIQLEAWSPLGQGELLKDETLKGISEKYQRTAAQVILRWHLQKGIIPIPKTARKERVVENYQIFDFNIDEADLILIDNLNRDLRFGPHPDSFQEFFGS